MPMNLKMVNKYINKNPRAIFYFSLLISAIIHIIVIIKIPDKRFISINAQKGRITILNFSLDNPDNRSKSNVLKRKSEAHMNKNKMVKRGGEIPSFGENIEKKDEPEERFAATPPSISEKILIRIKEIYEDSILKRIHRMKYYPLYARKMKMEGVVKLKFTIKREGKLKGHIAILKGCQHEVLNKAGVRTVLAANPFPPIPLELRSDEMTFTIDVAYRLDVW